MTDYFADLPDEDRAAIAELAAKYLPLIPGCEQLREIPDETTLWQLIAWQRIEIEVLEAHADWLAKVKAAIERSGRQYTRENFLRYCALREHE